eukprot:1460259-Pyramimonas_sp.AAC.1
MPGVSAAGRSSCVTVADCDVSVGLSTDPAGLDDRDRALSTPVGLATDPEEPSDFDREPLGNRTVVGVSLALWHAWRRTQGGALYIGR